MKKDNTKTTQGRTSRRGARKAVEAPGTARKGRGGQGQRDGGTTALPWPLEASTGGRRELADVPSFFRPVWPSSSELERAQTADKSELLAEAARLVRESAAFLVALELAERVRRLLEGTTAGGWLYVDLLDDDDDVGAWLDALADGLPGAEPREVVRGLGDVLAEFGNGADKSEALRRVAVLQRGAASGLALWRNVLGVVVGILVAKGWEVPDEKTEVEKVLAEVRSLKRAMSQMFGKVNRKYTEEDFRAMEAKLGNRSQLGAASDVLTERFGIENPSSKEVGALVKAFQRWKKSQTARSDKL